MIASLINLQPSYLNFIEHLLCNNPTFVLTRLHPKELFYYEIPYRYDYEHHQHGSKYQIRSIGYEK